MQKINANITHNYFFYFFLRADKLGGETVDHKLPMLHYVLKNECE